MLGLDRRHAPRRDPALDDRAFGLEPGLEVAVEAAADPRRAMQDLIGEDLGGLGPAPGEIELGGDIVGKRALGIGLGPDRLGGVDPKRQDLVQHPGVERLFGAEIVVQIGLGHAGEARDGGGRRGGKAALGGAVSAAARIFLVLPALPADGRFI